MWTIWRFATREVAREGRALLPKERLVGGDGVFALDEADVARTTFQYVGAYKLLITVFCFAPWVALKLMS